MAVGASERRMERAPAVEEIFGPVASVALDLLEVMERAWHDTYGEITFPNAVFADLMITSEGRLDRLVEMVRLALVDWRDLRVLADDLRNVR